MKTKRYFNRELSWLEFNARVLDEALDSGTPLLERLKFLAITSSNFDEFFMVRVASLKARIASGDLEPEPSGLAPAEILAAVAKRAKEIVRRQYDCLLGEILPALEREGLAVVRPSTWTAAERRKLEDHFADLVAPLLTPLRVESPPEPGASASDGLPGKSAAGDVFPGSEVGLSDAPRPLDLEGPDASGKNALAAHDIPSIGNLRIHAAFLLRPEQRSAPRGTSADRGADRGAGRDADAAKSDRLAVVQVPPNLDRFIRIPTDAPGLRIALLDDLIAAFGQRLFPGYAVVERLLFKVTRDADIGVDEDREDDFIAAMEEVLVGRQNSWPVRLTVSADSERLAERLMRLLGLGIDDVYTLPGPIDLRTFMELASNEGIAAIPGGERLRYQPWPPIQVFEPAEDSTIWDEIRSGDRLLHVPYESFDPVVRFLEAAADDPAVLAIKMTLYRTSGNSPVVRALTRAARNGKQVAVLVELKARFDEERNIAWASRLEQAGAIVVYGLARLKVHAKAALVVRREDNGSIRRYLHLSTGNYNDRTARLYSDLSLFTANEDLCRDASVFFNMITGYSTVQELRFLAVAPFDLKSRLLGMIAREAQRSSPESPGLLMFKMNALVDADTIDALYRANAAGVRVLLNVRGVCVLVPGVKGLSENIRVVSVLGRYLEHSRVFYFRNGGAEEMYLSSADLMPRNLEKRIELLFPILDETLRERVHEILAAYFMDSAGAHSLARDGKWKRVEPAEGEKAYSSQADFYSVVKRRRALLEEPPERELPVRRRPS